MNIGVESETVEFKKSTSELKEGVASIAAMLNKHGHGELCFGVRNNGDVCGMQVSDATLREIGQAIDQSIEPRIHPTIERLEDEESREYIRVTFQGGEAPYACKGVYRLRVSDSDVVMSAHEVKRRAAHAYFSEHPWDSEVNDTPLDAVEEDALKDYVQRGNDCGRITFKYAGIEDALTRLELMNDGRLTNAATVLFCRPRFIMLKMAIFATDARINILDMHQERENLFVMAKMAEDYVMHNIKWRFVIDGSPQRDEVPEIPRAVVREAVINAFCHRDYTSQLAVQVDIFGEKIEIFSPGWFPPEVTPGQLLEDDAMPFSRSPNPLIAQSLYRSRDIESYGTGIRRIKDLCREADVDFEYVKDPHGTLIRFYRPNWFESGGASSGREAGARRSSMTMAEREDLAVAMARENGRVTTRDLMERAHVSRRTANATLVKLVGSNRLKVHAANPNDPHRYYTAT